MIEMEIGTFRNDFDKISTKAGDDSENEKRLDKLLLKASELENVEPIGKGSCVRERAAAAASGARSVERAGEASARKVLMLPAVSARGEGGEEGAAVARRLCARRGKEGAAVARRLCARRGKEDAAVARSLCARRGRRRRCCCCPPSLREARQRRCCCCPSLLR
jgi:hypothetical protein